MRFDPKFIPGADSPLKADGEIELPHELTALADQLREDAAHLAACYPARQTASIQQSPSASWRNRIAVSGAVICASAVAAAFIVWVSISQPAAPLVSQTERVIPPALDSSLSKAPATAKTTLSLTELSGPELEAFLDLIRREPDHAVNVSF